MTKLGGWHEGTDDLNEDVLVEQARGGDREAFGLLIRRYQRLVFRIVGGFLRNREDVEDVAQETFLRAFEGLQGFRAGSPFGPWIARIATRASYDRLRQRRRTSEVAWEDLPPAEQAAAGDLAAGVGSADRIAARDLLERAMASLSPKDRMVLILSDALGFSGMEVAQAMGCSSVAGRIRLHRARRAARKAIEGLVPGMGKKKGGEQE
jgi:RNA polymerase sigma-70 factor (ECF subfamily)